MKKQLCLTTLILFAVIILFANTNVQANFQSKPNTEIDKRSLNQFMYLVRAMEEDGQVMGLSETGDFTNGGTLLADTSNNIDVHMQKNTEYGAVLLLSASPQYGKQGSGSDSYINNSTSTGIATTTGNQYGVYEIGKEEEWVAAGPENSYSINKKNNAVPYNARYYNIYEGNIFVTKKGDATTETFAWKGASSNRIGFSINGTSFARRAFYIYSNNQTTSCGTEGGYWDHYGRAAIVCGEGF